MTGIILSAAAALLTGGCTLLIAVATARLIREMRPTSPSTDAAIRAALAAETGEWEPYRCECGEWVTTPEDERTVGHGIARERVCVDCYETARPALEVVG